MTETVDVFYQETNYVTLLIFWLLIDVCFLLLLLLHISFIFDCLVYFFHYSVLCDIIIFLAANNVCFYCMFPLFGIVSCIFLIFIILYYVYDFIIK